MSRFGDSNFPTTWGSDARRSKEVCKKYRLQTLPVKFSAGNFEAIRIFPALKSSDIKFAIFIPISLFSVENLQSSTRNRSFVLLKFGWWPLPLENGINFYMQSIIKRDCPFSNDSFLLYFLHLNFFERIHFRGLNFQFLCDLILFLKILFPKHLKSKHCWSVSIYDVKRNFNYYFFPFKYQVKKFFLFFKFAPLSSNFICQKMFFKIKWIKGTLRIYFNRVYT